MSLAAEYIDPYAATANISRAIRMTAEIQHAVGLEIAECTSDEDRQKLYKFDRWLFAYQTRLHVLGNLLWLEQARKNLLAKV